MMKTLLTAACLAIAGAAPSLAQTSWQMPTPYPESSAVTKNVLAFAEEVSELTDGKLNIVVHPAASLIKHGEIKNAVRSGQVEIGEILMSTLSNEDPAYELESLPFLVGTFEDAQRMWEVTRDHTAQDMNRQRMTLLFANPWSPQGLYSAEPVESAADMRGGRFRAYNYTTERIAQLAGAVPTQVEAADLAQAFSTGRVNMMVTSTATGVSAAVWDFLNHFYDVRVSYSKDIVFVNTEALEALEPDVREGLMEAARRAEARGWEMAQADHSEGLKILADNGVEVGEGSETLRTELREIGTTMVEEWKERAGETGAALLAAYQN